MTHPHWMRPVTVSPFSDLQNNLGILWSEREEIETAPTYLESSEALYSQYMKEVGYLQIKM